MWSWKHTWMSLPVKTKAENLQKSSVVIGFRSLVQAFTQLDTVVRVCTPPLLGRRALIGESGLHLDEMFCDTLTTPLVAQVVRRHEIIKARLTCTGAVAVWGTAALSTCGDLGDLLVGRWMLTVGWGVMPVASLIRCAAEWLLSLIARLDGCCTVRLQCARSDLVESLLHVFAQG